jgi:DNA-binding protein HU-beta|tara:strand:- start:138 stop:458 length:321 start_codon:yes stop_codon:yes gene_type:complete
LLGKLLSSLKNRGFIVNKSELIQAIAVETDVPKAAAKRILNAITSAINTSLINGEPVSLVGFGTFSVKSRSARSGRNPKTGTSIEIASANRIHFKPGKTLKTEINS